MATLESLKHALRQKAKAITPSSRHPLSDTQYSTGFEILMHDSGGRTYQEFNVPQLSQLLEILFNSRVHISVLEIGPGAESIFGYLPSHQRRKIRSYTAFEPHGLYATKLEESLRSTSKLESPMPCLHGPPSIIQRPFDHEDSVDGGKGDEEQYDIILFCHSMYGMKRKHKFIERALKMLTKLPEGGIVTVFHREGALHLNHLVCYRTASFPNGRVRVADNNEVIDSFAPFIAGFALQDADEAVRVEWRKVCRTLGRSKEANSEHLMFSSPDVMVAFTQHATMLSELAAQVPLSKEEKTVKSWEARRHHPASLVRPTEVRHVQECVRWALKHKFGLIVVGGGHSGHCLRSGVVSIDMSAFDQIHIFTARKDEGDASSDRDTLVVVEAGCRTGDIVCKTMAAGVTVPLGARPSVGAGLWLQGGIGHLARLYGLACDAVVGAIIVSVDSSQILCVGRVPSQHQPVGAVRPDNESDLLWAIKGAGTNFGILVSVTFNAFPAPTYNTRNWRFPLSDTIEARIRLREFDLVARKLERHCSADAYLFWDAEQLHLGVTMFESSTTTLTGISAQKSYPPTLVDTTWGPSEDCKAVDGVGLFKAEMYVSGMHGGHSGGKTSSFKRCLFLECIGEKQVADRLVAALENRPSPLCYLHLLQGGGAVGEIAADATAFGCREWDFACIITGVWPRDQDGTEAAQLAVQWVYNVVGDLLSLSSGAYGADLGPDPRDATLAARAFGPNGPRLNCLKRKLDPNYVLAYACPLPRAPKLILLVTGKSCAGKDYCAGVWASSLVRCTHNALAARAVSISDATKREYAAARGADLGRLLSDRSYKEQHRSALTSFYQEQVQQRPRLPVEHFLNVVYSNMEVDMLLITGMRDEAPVTSFSHLVPNIRLLEVHVHADEKTRRRHRGPGGDRQDANDNNSKSEFILTGLDYRPSFVFHNDTSGNEATDQFGEKHLLPFFHKDLQQLADMAHPILDFPRPGMEFRHVLGISQQPGGLALCTSLLKSHFTGDWAKVDAVACCEVGGFVYASPLALQVDVPLVLIREAGKLPPPTVCVSKPPSYISSLEIISSKNTSIEMELDVVPKGASVVVVDDVLSTGETLCAILQLLGKAGIGAKTISIMTVAQFPAHRGRELLRERGFGLCNVQSLLVFGGT